ncbi:MAG: hypothetical protein ABF289_19320 [Clostridiales bacterium]
MLLKETSNNETYETRFKNILKIMSSSTLVKNEVIKNHDNNLWWPLYIKDWKIRFIVAGLSTRVSYNCIETYKSVIKDLSNYKYEEIKKMSDDNLIKIISRLGLSNTRLKYIRSAINFIDNYSEQIFSKSNNELIELIQNNVNGASYKVAQCCVLYIRGYYTGIMPVDRGIKDVFAPCIGFEHYKKAIGHDILRKNFEYLIKKLNLDDLIDDDYSKLKLPENKPLTWWSHLVMIYYKRIYCNKKNPKLCELNKNGILLKKCCLNSKKKTKKG